MRFGGRAGLADPYHPDQGSWRPRSRARSSGRPGRRRSRRHGNRRRERARWICEGTSRRGVRLHPIRRGRRGASGAERRARHDRPLQARAASGSRRQLSTAQLSYHWRPRNAAAPAGVWNLMCGTTDRCRASRACRTGATILRFTGIACRIPYEWSRRRVGRSGASLALRPAGRRETHSLGCRFFTQFPPWIGPARRPYGLARAQRPEWRQP